VREDIAPIMRRWPYDPDSNIRFIEGNDGKKKLQVRLPLGIEQYEVDGRPDGLRPQGKESYLEVYLGKLDLYKKANATDLGFSLSREDAALLIEEGILYYYRYVLLFQIGDLRRCIRDTARNLRLADLLKNYAEDEADKESVEQYRPYIIRMNCAAKALLSASQGAFDKALSEIASGVREIEELPEMENPNFRYERKRSLAVLREMEKNLRNRKPPSRREVLQKRLERAVREENYELAAKIRDQIKALNSGSLRRIK